MSRYYYAGAPGLYAGDALKFGTDEAPLPIEIFSDWRDAEVVASAFRGDVYEVIPAPPLVPIQSDDQRGMGCLRATVARAVRRCVAPRVAIKKLRAERNAAIRAARRNVMMFNSLVTGVHDKGGAS